jgi:hypothetical protein
VVDRGVSRRSIAGIANALDRGVSCRSIAGIANALVIPAVDLSRELLMC